MVLVQGLRKEFITGEDNCCKKKEESIKVVLKYLCDNFLPRMSSVIINNSGYFIVSMDLRLTKMQSLWEENLGQNPILFESF